MGAVRIELWIILALCLLLMPFLHGPVLGPEGNEPSTCEHVHCDKQEVTVSWKEKQEGHQLIRSKLNRSLRILAMTMAARRRLATPVSGHPTPVLDRHPIPYNPRGKP